MSYIISNKYFPESQKKNDNLFISNNLIYKIKGNTYIDGYLYKHKPGWLSDKNIDNEKFKELNGSFTIIQIHENKIRVVSDKFGQVPCFIFQNRKKIVISDNIWDIYKIVDENEILINKTWFKEQVFFYNTVNEGSTFLKNVNRTKAATIYTIDSANNRISEFKYWEYIQKVNHDITKQEIIHHLDTLFTDYFSFVEERFKNKSFAFGNSGGLDSRIIPHYAKKAGMDIFGITIGKPKNKFQLDSISFSNAKKIAKYYGIDTYSISSHKGTFQQRMENDILNNPLGSSELFKNPATNNHRIDYFFCGGNGYIIGFNQKVWGDFLNHSDDSNLKNLFIESFSMQNVLAKNKNILSKYNEFIKHLLSEEDIKLMEDNGIDFFNQYRDIDRFSFTRIVQTRLLNIHSPSGGYESLNGSTFPLYLYYPSIFEFSQIWPLNFFHNRSLLEDLIYHISPELVHIPDQNLNIINKNQNKYILRLIKYFIKSGIEHDNLSKTKNFKTYALNVLEKHNPLWDDMFKKQITSKMFFDSYNIKSLQILKLKATLDKLYYEK